MKRQAKAASTATLSLVALLFSLLLFAAPAHASKGVVEEFGSDGSGPNTLPTHPRVPCLSTDQPDCLSQPAGIEVNYATGDVYVVDRGNQRVVRFSEDGEFERAWGWDVDADDPSTEFEICVAPATCKAAIDGDGIGQLTQPADIAIDQSNGDVYVSTGAFGPGGGVHPTSIKRYDLDGNYLSRQEAPKANLVVKPGSNSLLIGGDSIVWRDSSGNPLATFGFGVPNYSTNGIGVDSAGNIYTGPVQDAFGSKSALKLSSGGAPLGQFAAEALNGRAPSFLTADPVNDRVYVARFDRPVNSNNPPDALREIAELDPSGQLLDLHATGIKPPRGIAVNPSSGRIYVTVGQVQAIGSGGAITIPSRVLVIDTVTNPPVPTITSIVPTASGATLNGTVNPQGTAYATGYHWEYRKQGVQSWTVTPSTDIDVGNGTDPEAAGPRVISNLEPNTTYEVRLVAIREGGAGSAIDADSFKTLALPPTVTERSAYPVTDTTAQIRAAVHPHKSATEYFFEWGTDESYGNTIATRDAGEGNAEVPAYATLKGLAPETTYHFRLVADNGVGDPVEGPDVELTTRSTAEMAWAKRGIELASPPDTGGQNVVALLSRETDHVLWTTLAGAPGSPTGNMGAFVAERTLATPNGWASRSLLPPIDKLIGNGEATYVAVAASPDLRTVVFRVPFGPSIHFVRSNADGSQTPLATLDLSDSVTRIDPVATADLTHVFVTDRTRLIPAHPAGKYQIYDIGNGKPRLVSRLPGGGVPSCGIPNADAGSGFSQGGHPYTWFSSGVGAGVPLRVFFETAGNDCPSVNPADHIAQLYVRDDKGTASEADDETTLISGPPHAGPAAKAYFLRANAAGDEVVYATATRLTAADTNTNQDLYRWTMGEGNECLTCAVSSDADVRYGSKDRAVMVSSDLETIYFRSPKQLVPGEGVPGSENNLYVLRGTGSGVEVDYVGQGSSDPETIGGKTNELSADGEVMVFQTSAAGVTPDRTGGFEQFYRYDSTDGTIECISCPPPGVAAGEVKGIVNTGSVSSGAIEALTKRRLLSEDGNVFAFMSTVPYVPADINGGPDVYEWRRDGGLRLLTDGVTQFSGGSNAPAVQGVSADGRNVMFTVAAKLTGFELEGTRQVYVARTGGGFPPPPPPPDPCVEDACQGPLQVTPSFSDPGSASLRGAANRKAAKPTKKRCTKNKVRRGKRCVAKRKKTKAKTKKSRAKTRRERSSK